MIWFLIFLAALFLAGERFFGKEASILLKPPTVLLTMQFAMIFVGIIIFFASKGLGLIEGFQISSRGTFFALLAGFAVACFDALMIILFYKGMEVSFFTPVAAGASVIFASLLGIIFFGEEFSLVKAVSILIISGGIVGLMYKG